MTAGAEVPGAETNAVPTPGTAPPGGCRPTVAGAKAATSAGFVPAAMTAVGFIMAPSLADRWPKYAKALNLPQWLTSHAHQTLWLTAPTDLTAQTAQTAQTGRPQLS